jgi:transcriptional regulator with XRE-family HTH domain
VSIPFGIFFWRIPKMFGSKLRELRESKGLSQPQLARLSGLSQVGISHWERGERSPNWDAVLALCKALGVPCTVFAEAEESEAKPNEKRGPGRPKKE